MPSEDYSMKKETKLSYISVYICKDDKTIVGE